MVFDKNIITSAMIFATTTSAGSFNKSIKLPWRTVTLSSTWLIVTLDKDASTAASSKSTAYTSLAPNFAAATARMPLPHLCHTP